MKESILKALRQGGPVSGEKLGKDEGISRTAVWKCIKELRREGYRIDSFPGKGYALLGVPDSLFPQEIREGLRTHVFGHETVYHSEVESTQEVAKGLAMQGEKEGTTVLAERQTAGRGRLGRRWSSLPGSFALSVILRPESPPSEAPKLTIMAGVAVALAIAKTTNAEARLKWPNDIIVGGKKVGGILTEMSAEMDRINYIVIGIGLNVNTARKYIPHNIKGGATSLRVESGMVISRVKLLQAILEELESLYAILKHRGFEPIRQQWTTLSNTIGVRVIITGGPENMEGEALEMDHDAALILRKENGTLERVIAGDVSLRTS